MKKNLLLDFVGELLSQAKESRSFVIVDFRVGDTVSVRYKITEGDSSRIQAFVGTVIAKTKSFSHYSATFTVRKISDNIGVERKFLLHSPVLVGIEILKSGSVRSSKIYYLRRLTGKAARIKEKSSSFTAS